MEKDTKSPLSAGQEKGEGLVDKMTEKPLILREGYPFIGTAAALTALFAWLGWLHAAVVPLALTLYFAYFFRCPKRVIPEGDDILVSPADGTVMAVEDDVQEDLFLGEKCHKITIFLSVFNVHTNRAPMAGRISLMSYTQGRFRPAYTDGVGYENERGAIGITGEKRSVLVVQIAGILARRVVLWSELGRTIRKGELYGMIKFGSCTELYVPGDVDILVKKGDKVCGGSTIVGRLK